MTTMTKLREFNFPEGTLLSSKYEIVEKLGGGWEGEVYIVKELLTGILRAAKFFFPHRNPHNRAVKFYAKKLHKLRHCTVLIRYITQEVLEWNDHEIIYLISDYVEGKPLSKFLEEQKKLSPFQAVHLLHALARGIEEIHNAREYHGDLHTDNIIVQRYGLGFELKLIDMFHWGTGNQENIRGDVIDLIKVFHESLGGAKHYPSHPKAIKEIICGLKKNLIFSKFKTAGQLRCYLENISWD
jgi:tRNA A-37 threonylcarbamoyl transferase component Bud32